MSIVLYALGAALLAWSGYLVLSGETYAAMDIAASLAGWGVFAIGLGAVTAAIADLTKAIAGPRGRQEPIPFSLRRLAGERRDDVLPVFVPRGEEPAHFEPSPPPPAAAAAAAERKPAPLPAIELDLDLGVEPEPDPKPNPEPEIRPEPKPKPAPVPPAARTVPAPPSSATAPRPIAEPAPSPSAKDERRAARLKARQDRQNHQENKRREPPVELPKVATAALGGGLAAALVAKARDASAKDASAPSGMDAEPEVKSTPAEPTSGARPIMPMRERERGSDRPEAEPKPEPTTESVADEAVEATPRIKSEPEAAAQVASPAPAAADAADDAVTESQPTDVTQTEPDTVDQPSDPAPSVAAAPMARPDPAPAPLPNEPKVPEWLARARARRQARLEAEQAEPEGPIGNAAVPEPEAAPKAEPEPEPSPEPVFEAERPAEPEMDAAPESDAVPTVVREGEHNGVVYRFFDDGSVEAESPHGVRRFASVDELRSTVIAARGEDYDDHEDREEPQRVEAEPDRHEDPLDAALAELEGGAAPEVRLNPRDRHGGR